MLGAAPLGGGIASRAVSYAAGSQLRDTSRGHLPGWARQRARPRHERPERANGEPDRHQAAPGRDARRRRRATGGATAAPRAAGSAAGTGNGAASAGGSTAAPGAGRDRGQRALVHATADGAGQRRRTAGAERVADSELCRPRAGLRQRDVRGQYRERDQPRVSAEQARAALASLPENTQRGDRAACLRARRGRARASRLPGAGRVVARGARGAAHARRRQPRRARTSHRRGRRRQPSPARRAERTPRRPPARSARPR